LKKSRPFCLLSLSFNQEFYQGYDLVQLADRDAVALDWQLTLLVYVVTLMATMAMLLYFFFLIT
jgi:hypothetical protein